MTPLRARLQAQGYLTPDGHLTEAGNAEVDALIARLRREVARARGDGVRNG